MRLPFSLTINSIFLAILALFLVGNIAHYYVFSNPDPYVVPDGSALPVPQQVGKSKIYVSKERDASMYIERTRRRAIQGANRVATKDPKFIYWNKDSTNGSLETFFLTSVCPCLPSKVCNYLYDGGNANANYCYIVDGNGQEYTLDLGNATITNCPPKNCNYLYDGGNDTANYCYIVDGDGNQYSLDLGNATITNCSA